MGDSGGDREGRNNAAPAAWRDLVAALLKYVGARGDLAQIEAQEAAENLVRALVHGALGFMLGVGAWVLTVPALVWVVCKHQGWPLERALIVVGIAHAVLGLIFIKAMRARLARARWFAETLEQFKKDRAWITQETEQR